MGIAREKRSMGCFMRLLIFVAVLAVIGAGVWKFVLFKGPGALAKEIINGPIDPIASSAVSEALASNGVPGSKAYVFPLPAGEGTATVIVLDPSQGFTPASGPEGKKMQALQAIKEIVDANSKHKLDLQRVGLEYQENGEPIIALTAPMEALTALAAGKMSEAQFLSAVDVKLKNVTFVKELLGL